MSVLVGIFRGEFWWFSELRVKKSQKNFQL